MQKKRIAIFASGKGSNALNIIDHFSDHKNIEVAVVITNKSEAPVVQNAKNKGVEVICLSNESAADASLLIDICSDHHVDYIVLAGGCASIPEIEVTVQDRTQVKTIIANPFQNMLMSSKIRQAQLAVDAPALLIACGLAMRGVSI